MTQTDFIQRQLDDLDQRLAEIEEALKGFDELVTERNRLRAARAALAGETADVR